MPMNVVTGAVLQCTFGVAPSTLNVLPAAKVVINNMPAATINDNVPMVNIPPFGMCQSMANPTVAAATAAASGVLTPMPCIPVIPAPWAPGTPTTMIGGKVGLGAGSMALCAWGGQISITSTGQVTTQSN